jgi:hypothetical protein
VLPHLLELAVDQQPVAAQQVGRRAAFEVAVLERAALLGKLALPARAL